MICYRIYTEDLNSAGILEILEDVDIQGCTLLTGTGVWEGTTENCLIIECVGEDLNVKVPLAALKIKRLNNQDAVLITAHTVKQELV